MAWEDIGGWKCGMDTMNRSGLCYKSEGSGLGLEKIMNSSKWWRGRVVKVQCFESCEVYSRGFESRRWNH